MGIDLKEFGEMVSDIKHTRKEVAVIRRLVENQDGRLRDAENTIALQGPRIETVEKRPGPIKLIMQALAILSLFVGILVGLIRVL